jgi:hypothetical protein
MKERFLGFVAAMVPGLLSRYERTCANTIVSSGYQTATEKSVARIRERHGFTEGAMREQRVEGGGFIAGVKIVSDGIGQLALPL